MSGETEYHQISTNLLRAVVLIVRLAGLTLHAGPDLSADTHTVPDLDRRHFLAHLDSSADDFVSNTQWHGSWSPAFVDGVDIRTANAAADDLDIDVSILELLRCKLWEEPKISIIGLGNASSMVFFYLPLAYGIRSTSLGPGP